MTVRAAELVRVIEITQAGKKEETPSASVDGNLIVIGANTSTSQRQGNVTVRAAELVRVIEITQAGKKEETPSAGGSIEDFTENEEDW